MRSLFVVLLIGAALGMVAAVRGPVAPALACSIGPIRLEQAAREADAAAIVYVTSVQGPQNNSPALLTVDPARAAAAARERPIDLEGYGASLQVHTVIFGETPASFDVEAEARNGIERSLRAREAGMPPPPPCPIGLAVAHYVAGQYYLVLLRRHESGWRSFYTFNYRVEGSELLTTKVYPEEQREWAGPWEIEVKKPLYDRYFEGLGEYLYSDTIAMRKEEFWRVNAPRVPVDAYIAALRAARAEPFVPFAPAIRPPTTGDGGLAR